jgi:hypothetical protein
VAVGPQAKRIDRDDRSGLYPLDVFEEARRPVFRHQRQKFGYALLIGRTGNISERM